MPRITIGANGRKGEFLERKLEQITPITQIKEQKKSNLLFGCHERNGRAAM